MTLTSAEAMNHDKNMHLYTFEECLSQKKILSKIAYFIFVLQFKILSIMAI